MTKTVLESAYFHISNSGLTISFVEESSDIVTTWAMEAKLSAFGCPLTVSIPIPNAAGTGWLLAAITKVQDRITNCNNGYHVWTKSPKLFVVDGVEQPD